MFRLSRSSYANKIVFKGGTSLSKGFNLIERFSEDVDIAVINEKIDSGNQLKKTIRSIEKEITMGLQDFLCWLGVLTALLDVLNPTCWRRHFLQYSGRSASLERFHPHY